MPGKRTKNGMDSITQRPDGSWRGSLTLADGSHKEFRAKSYKEVARNLRQLTYDRDPNMRDRLAEMMDTILAPSATASSCPQFCPQLART